MMIIAFLMFVGTILIAIYEEDLPKIFHHFGFMFLCYTSVILFALGVKGLWKNKKESVQNEAAEKVS